MTGLPPSGKPLSADDYAERHDAALDFESVCLQARQAHNLQVLRRLDPAVVLEVGCGPERLVEQALVPPGPGALRQWVIVEPATRWAEAARQRFAGQGSGAGGADGPAVHVIRDYIESAAPALAALWPAGPAADLVLVSGVVHETHAPEALLRAALGWLKPGGHLLVSVPNADSFHRLLAVDMGLVARPDALGERNRLLGQPRVFDADALRRLVAEVAPELREVALDGYLFKPFTHAQMAALLPALGPRGVHGLIAMGGRFPAHAAEIALLARRPA